MQCSVGGASGCGASCRPAALTPTLTLTPTSITSTCCCCSRHHPPPTLHHRIVPFRQRPANGAPFVYYCTELFHAGDTDSGSDGDDVDLDRVCTFVELVLDALDVKQVPDLCPHSGLYRGVFEPFVTHTVCCAAPGPRPRGGDGAPPAGHPRTRRAPGADRGQLRPLARPGIIPQAGERAAGERGGRESDGRETRLLASHFPPFFSPLLLRSTVGHRGAE